ncbi:hypothetical protein P775_20345 [Puniceibacterium antarcticum]|uniref:AsmA domain-containing protein n=1 Tax=Puniceibacterium antarcticum TaxID=1206336 RepID=A0A2G8R9U6_9RHOB|nr:AsmA family protein [Puniceibacterium antarcticum]PIL18302.1 hypothetical protein P775_20345 [Puniceibacterium antarcticum]
MRVIWKILGLFVFILGVAFASLLFLPAERLGRIAADQLSAQIGRDVSLGDVSVSFWPVLGIDAGGIRIANADWSDAGAMLTADRAEIGVEPLSVLSGNLRFRSIRVIAPTILLQRNGDGAVNWDLGADTGGDASASLPDFSLDALSITGGGLRYLAAGQTPVEIRNLELTLAWPDRGGPATLKAGFSPAAEPVAVTAQIESPVAFLTGAVSGMDLELSTLGGTGRFEGQAGMAMEATGRLNLALSNTEQFLSALGQPSVVLPEGLGQSLSATTQIALAQDGSLSLREGDLTLDQNRLSVSADIRPGDVPHISAQIRGETLELPTFAGVDGAQSASGWPTDRLDASALGTFDGDITVELDRLVVGGFRFGQSLARMTVDQSRAVFDIEKMQGYQGILSGQFIANNRAGLSVGGTLKAEGMELRDLLEDAADVKKFTGKADAQLQFLGSGQSVDAIVRSLSGNGSLRAGPGVISGMDLDAVFRGGLPGSGTTVFDDMTASFAIENGVLRNDDLVLDLPVLAASGAGKVDLGAQSLDYLVTGTSAEARNGRGLSVPVRVKGPWSDTKISADLDAAIEANFSEEKQQLEREARDKVNKALQDSLGVSVDEGQSVEDAIRDKLRGEAAKGLMQLLDR